MLQEHAFELRSDFISSSFFIEARGESIIRKHKVILGVL